MFLSLNRIGHNAALIGILLSGISTYFITLSGIGVAAANPRWRKGFMRAVLSLPSSLGAKVKDGNLTSLQDPQL